MSKLIDCKFIEPEMLDLMKEKDKDYEINEFFKKKDKN